MKYSAKLAETRLDCKSYGRRQALRIGTTVNKRFGSVNHKASSKTPLIDSLVHKIRDQHPRETKEKHRERFVSLVLADQDSDLFRELTESTF